MSTYENIAMNDYFKEDGHFLLHRNYTNLEYFNGALFEGVMGGESLC